LEELFHIGPGGKDPLAKNIRLPVQDMIENLETDMGHPHFVYVGKGEGKFQTNAIGILPDRIYFATQVSGGLGDFKEIVAVHAKILTFPILAGK